MRCSLANGRIRQICSVVPSTKVDFLADSPRYGFSKSKAIRMKQTFGYDQRRVAAPSECASDFAVYGLQHLFAAGLDRAEIGALIFVSQTPDHFMPATSYLIHGRLGLGQGTVCLDVNQGCNGYIYGLYLAQTLLPTLGGRVVALINADTLSKATSDQDHKIHPLIGDCAAITILEPSTSEDIHIALRSDGSRADWLEIPAGGFRLPKSDATSTLVTSSDGVTRSAEHFTMNGPGVFTFTQTDVAALIEQSLVDFGIDQDRMDRFFFHQPNRFLLQKLADALGIDPAKMPNATVEQYGNQSGASIPHTICLSSAQAVTSQRLECCLSGFGVGLSWGVAMTGIGPLHSAEIIEKPLVADHPAQPAQHTEDAI